MKQIKFRAWDGEEMNYPGWYQVSSDGEMSWVGEATNRSSDCIMQFTGILDKNGKEIYEGDIVEKIIDKHNTDYNERPTVWFQVVKWNNESASWGIWSEYVDRDGPPLGPCYESTWDDDVLSPTDIEELEVIGNIYENSEVDTDAKLI